MTANANPTQQEIFESAAFLTEQFDAPVFFGRLEQNHGIKPRTEKEAQQLMEIGMALEAAENNGQIKSADADDNPFLSGAVNDLRTLLQSSAQPDVTDRNLINSVIRENPLAKTAALLYAYAANGGEIAEDAPVAQKK